MDLSAIRTDVEKVANINKARVNRDIEYFLRALPAPSLPFSPRPDLENFQLNAFA